MSPLRLVPGLALMALALPASAEPWNCRFTVECVAAEACGESAFEVEVIAADHAGDLFLSSVSGDSPVTRMTEDDGLPVTYASAGSTGLAELLTIEPDLTALMTVHFFDGVAAAATYFGTCEVLD